MAQELLNNLLNFKTSPTEILEWLTSDDSNDEQWTKFSSICPRNEFISFFLDYLREQYMSILQDNNAIKQTPAKKALLQPQASNVDKSKETNSQKLEAESCILKSGLGDNDFSIKQIIIDTARYDQLELSKDNGIGKCIKSPETIHTPERSIVNRNPDFNQAASTTSPQTSTPVANKKTSSGKKRAAFITFNPSEKQEINPHFKNSVECEHYPNRRTSRNISFDDNSFPSLGARNSNSFDQSRNLSRDESSDFSHSNLSIRSNISGNNKILQSPVSPLYCNPASMLSPINLKGYQNRFHNSSPNNNFNNITSTPQRMNNNPPKSLKTTPRQTYNLSDFITTDTRSSKKGNVKKAQSKSWSKGDEQNDNDACNVISNTSRENSENKRKKRLKPTTLAHADNKGDKENTVFEEVSRPSRPNDPQFMNVPDIDKSVKNESFQDESLRNELQILKIEKQKKSEVATNLNVIDEQMQPKWKISQRTPSKITKPIGTIIPDKTLVENIEVLNLLAELYSGFLDSNLVFNPMTELHLIINLITNQYRDNLSSMVQSIEERLENCSIEQNQECKYEKKPLSVLKKSLNFDDLVVETNDIDDNIKFNNDNSQCDDKSASELGCSSLKDNTEQKIGVINKKLKQVDVNIDQTTNKDNDLHQVKALEDTGVVKDCVKLYLNTPHNCVYFASQVLHLQKDFLKCLDRVTLKLLCENNQMSLFQPELCKYLDSVYNIKVSESNKTKTSMNIGIVELNVCFQIDTDNRENFPSSTAFSNFRKQRDQFYEILKIWEDNHSVPGWSFEVALRGKIRNIFNTDPDITNFTHFTRLFKSQMLISCIQSGQQEDLLDEEPLPDSFLKNMNPEKLAQLNKKFVTQSSTNGPVPPPSFPSFQEFYMDFILHAANHNFYTYLENTLIHEIMELNNTQFSASDIEDTETEVDELTKQSFVICLSSLRLLGKFLGYLTSLPFKSKTSMLDDVIASQIVLRKECLPRIDLQYCLHNAIIQGKLSLTVPWIVEYLSMMDHASLLLPYYKRTLEILYCIYRVSNYRAITNADELMSQNTAVLISLSIGWLFELSIFPTELYYSWQAKYSNKTIKIITQKHQLSILDVDDSVVSTKHSLFLDKLEIVDDRTLYSCCPFLREFNILLTSGNSNVNNGISIRRVNVTTCQLPVQKPLKKVNTKHLEIQLEEAFFHGQPMSTRKTVEYVSERVSSSSVKYICNNLLPVERKNISLALKRLVQENHSDILNQNPEKLKTTLSKDIYALSIKAAKIIKEESDKIIPSMCETRVNQSLEALLADDCLKPVKEMCMKIATRMTMERIHQWIQSHIMGGSIFRKDMELELSRITKESEDVVEKKCHNDNAASPTNILDGLREIIWNLMETRGQHITTEVLIKFLDQLKLCLTERRDLKLGSERMITSLSVDLCLFLILCRYDLFTKEIQEKVYKVWKIDSLKLSESDSPLSRILSPRNIMLMSQTPDNSVWLNLGNFLNSLLIEGILTIDSLSEQAAALFRREWPVIISKNLSVCLKQAISDYKSSDEETEKIRLLLGWIAGAHNDMDCDSFDFTLD